MQIVKVVFVTLSLLFLDVLFTKAKNEDAVDAWKSTLFVFKDSRCNFMLKDSLSWTIGDIKGTSILKSSSNGKIIEEYIQDKPSHSYQAFFIQNGQVVFSRNVSLIYNEDQFIEGHESITFYSFSERIKYTRNLKSIPNEIDSISINLYDLENRYSSKIYPLNTSVVDIKTCDRALMRLKHKNLYVIMNQVE